VAPFSIVLIIMAMPLLLAVAFIGWLLRLFGVIPKTD